MVKNYGSVELITLPRFQWVGFVEYSAPYCVYHIYPEEYDNHTAAEPTWKLKVVVL